MFAISRLHLLALIASSLVALLVGGCPPPPPQLDRGPFTVTDEAGGPFRPAELKLDPQVVQLTSIGETRALTLLARQRRGEFAAYPVEGPAVQWTSSNPSIVQIDNGIVTALAEGDAEVTAGTGTVSDGAFVTVRIPPPPIVPVELIAQPADILLEMPGQTAQLQITAKLSDESVISATASTSGVVYASTDTNVATVSPEGLITALSNGSTLATARLGNLSSSAMVEVRIPNRAPELAAIGDRTIDLGSTLRIVLSAADPENQPVTFMAGPLPLTPNARFNLAAHELVFRPTADQAGKSFQFTFSASDGQLTDFETITVSVNPVSENDETSLSGLLLDTTSFISGAEVPVVGATISLIGTGVSTVTDADGRFSLAALPAGGVQIFDIDPSTAQNGPEGARYCGFREAIELFDHAHNIVERPFFLPRMETDSLTRVDPARTTIVRNPRLNITLTVPPNTARNEDGTPFTGELSISEVPEALAPASMPEFLEPGLLITVQPIGVSYTQPVPLTFPNIDRLPPNAEVNLWSLDPSQGTFAIFGRLRVSADGATLQTVQGGLVANDWHGPAANLPDDDGGMDEAADNQPNGCSVTGSSSTELRSGKLQETHSLVSYRSMGRTHTLKLVYNSTSADPQPIISSLSTITSATAIPRTLSTRLAVGGIELPGEFHTSTAGFQQGRDESLRHAIQFDASSIPTGLYPYRLRVASNYERTTVSRQRASMVLVNNERESPFGAGWTLAGLQQIRIQPNNPKVVLTEGDGGIKTFTPQGASGPARTDLAFVMDGSGSISGGDFALQKDGVAGAVENPLVFPRDGSVSLTVIQFAGSSAVIEIPLRAITDNATATQIAGQIRAIPQRSGGTPMAEGLTAAIQALAGSPTTTRQVICLSTDGQPNDRQAALNAADAAVAAGVDEIDALAVGGGADVAFLETMVRNGFVVTVTSFQQFAQQIGDKLRSVIGGSPPGDFSFILRNDDGTYTRVMKDGTRHQFNSVGWHIESVEMTGMRTRFAYSTAGALETITDAANLTTTFAYSNGKLTTITDPANRVTRFEHDGRGALTRIVDPDNSERRFSYDQRFRLSGQVDQRNFATAYEFSLNGRHKRSLLADGTTQSVEPAETVGLVDTSNGRGTFDNPAPAARPDDHKSTFVDREGNRLTYRLNRFGEPTLTRTALGMTTETIRSDQNLPTRMTHPNGRIDEMRYDDRGNLLELKEAVGTPLQRITRYEYHPDFNKLTVIDQPAPNNENRRIRTLFDYDSAGNLIRSINPLNATRTFTYIPNTDVMATEKDENNQLTAYQYDSFGRLSETRTAAGGVTQYTRDTSGNILSVREASGSGAERTTRFTYDASNRLLTETDGEGGTNTFGYDAGGQLVEASNALLQAARLAYDEVGRLIRLDEPARGSTEIQYDNYGNIIALRASNNAIVRYGYDLDHRLVRVTDATGNFEQYDYDAGNNVSRLLDANNHATELQYDLFDRPVRRTNPLGQFHTFSYDALDNLNRQVSPAGTTIDNTFDDMSRLVRAEVPGNPRTYTYDAVGNLLTCNNNDSGLRWTYDGVNRITSASTVPGPSAVQPATTLTYSYDEAGNQVAMLTSLGTSTQYAYDRAGRLRRLTTPAGSSIEQRFDQEGKLLSIDLGLGITCRYTYGAATGRLEQLLCSSAGATLMDLRYSYDSIGHVSQVANMGDVHAFVYDPQGQLLSATSSGQAEVFSYDPAGNRTNSSATGVAVFDAANRLLADSLFAYAYDADGNLTRRTPRDPQLPATDFRWDAFGRLIEATDAVVSRYKYDGLGRLIQVTENGQATTFIYDRDDVAIEIAANGNATFITTSDDIDRPLERYDRGLGAATWLIADHVGSTRLLIDGNLAVSEECDYASFGITSCEPVPGLPRFQGRPQGKHGLLYFRSRWLDPLSGRFISSDAHPGILEVPGSKNGYTFALNDPINLTDPSGEIVPLLIAGALIGAGVNTGFTAIIAWYNNDRISARQLAGAAASGALSGGIGAVSGPLGGTIARGLGARATGLLAKAATTGVAGVGGAGGQALNNLIDPACTVSVQRSGAYAAVGGAISTLIPVRGVASLAQARYFAPRTVSSYFRTGNARRLTGALSTSSLVGAGSAIEP